MMKKITLVFVALLTVVSVLGQKKGKEIKGDKYFQKYSFRRAIDKYKAVDGLSIEGQRKLAESYMNINQNELSVDAYSEFINTENGTAEDCFNYASVLRLQGKYDESDVWMKKFQAKAPGDSRANNYVKNASELSKIQKDEGRYKISALDINTANQDFGPSYYGENQVVFTSSREGVKSIKRTYNWDNMPFLDMYISDNENSQLSNPSQLNRKVNNKMHEGPASFNKTTDFMAFTRNDYKSKGEDGTVNLQLFFAIKDEDGNWGKEKAFKLNSSEYSVGHPSLSADGNTLYFASDMPGGKGGVDIYKITKNSSGNWGKAINLGGGVNTSGNEMFPFYQESSQILFFTSNGHLGLGGLDLFLSPEMGNGMYSKVLNAGTPLNTRFDDFALIVDEKMRMGYFSSNREGGKGDDDIYGFELLKSFTFRKLITGVAKDTDGNILVGTNVSLFNASGKLVEEAVTLDNGSYTFSVDPDLNFNLLGTKPNYFEGKNAASTKTEDNEVVADLVLSRDPGLSLRALVTDTKTGRPLSGVKLVILDNLTNESLEFTTTESGDYFKPLTDKKLMDSCSYDISLSKEGYAVKTMTYNQVFTKAGKYEVHNDLDMGLDPIIGELIDIVQIDPINFNFDKYDIRADAEEVLDKIIEVMNKYPSMRVELGSHTDCRGSDIYNEVLSDRRAKASAAYIKKKITNPDRIFGKGYGEYRLLNDCKCDEENTSICTKEQHEKNRRTEFKVITMGDTNVELKNNSTDSFNK